MEASSFSLENFLSFPMEVSPENAVLWKDGSISSPRSPWSLSSWSISTEYTEVFAENLYKSITSSGKRSDFHNILTRVGFFQSIIEERSIAYPNKQERYDKANFWCNIIILTIKDPGVSVF